MKRKKFIIAFLLCFCLVAMGAGALFYFYPDGIPLFGENDPSSSQPTSRGGSASPAEDGPNGDHYSSAGTPPPSGNAGVIRSSVKLLDEEQSQSMQSQITEMNYTDTDNLSLTFGSSLPKVLTTMKKEDVLFLPVISGGVFSQTYIGKIEAMGMADGKAFIELSTPAIDEVFDKLALNIDTTLTKQNLVSADLLPGVSISYEKKDFDAVFSASSPQGEAAQPAIYTHIQGQSPHVLSLAASDSEPLQAILKIENLDLAKIFRLAKVLPEKPKDNQMEGYEGDNNLSLMLNGEIGFQNIHVYHDIDFDIKQKWLFQDLVVGATGEFAAKFKVDTNLMDMDMNDVLRQARSGFDPSKDNDKFVKDFGVISLEALKENTFPIAHLMWNVGSVPMIRPGSIKSEEMLAPLSIGVVISADIEGNITMKAFAEIQFTKKLDTGKLEVIRDSQLSFRNGGSINAQEKDAFAWKFGLESSGDLDFQLINLNISAYIFNLNVLRFTATGIGTEVAGSAKAAFTQDGVSEEDTGLSGYLNVYSRLLLKCNIAAKTKLFVRQRYAREQAIIDTKKVEAGEVTLLNLDYTWELWKHNHLTLGDLSTNYDTETMGYNQISAYDENHIYYKDINGYLTKISKKDGSDRATIMNDTFFIIVGIDNSYVYVMKESPDSAGFDLYRVSKKGTSSRMIQQGIANCVMQDSSHLYFIPADQQNICKKIDKHTLIASSFVTLENNDEKIQSLYNRNDNEYLLITMEESMFSFLVGPEIRYYAVPKTGEAAFSLPIEYVNFLKEQFTGYTAVTHMTSYGFLRNTAEEVFWESRDGSLNKKIQGISGWSPKEEGIFIQLDNPDQASRNEYPYVIARSLPENGEIEMLWKAASKQAFFTLNKYNGQWYFIDQTASDFILYCTDTPGGDLKELERVPISTFGSGLDTCSMSITDGRMFFFAIDGSRCNLLYRYDIKE